MRSSKLAMDCFITFDGLYEEPSTTVPQSSVTRKSPPLDPVGPTRVTPVPQNCSVARAPATRE
jgi:hypothetical protein